LDNLILKTRDYENLVKKQLAKKMLLE